MKTVWISWIITFAGCSRLNLQHNFHFYRWAVSFYDGGKESSASSHVNVSFLMECLNNKKPGKSTCKVVIWDAITLEDAVQREESPPLSSCFKTSVKTIIGVLFVCYQPVNVANPFPSLSQHCSILNLSPKGSTEPNSLSAALILRKKKYPLTHLCCSKCFTTARWICQKNLSNCMPLSLQVTIKNNKEPSFIH